MSKEISFKGNLMTIKNRLNFIMNKIKNDILDFENIFR